MQVQVLVQAGAVEFAVPKIELGDLSQRVAVWQTHLTLPQQKRPPPPGRWFIIGDASQLPLRGGSCAKLIWVRPLPVFPASLRLPSIYAIGRWARWSTVRTALSHAT